MKNKLHYSFLMGLTVIGLLLLNSFVGEFSVGGIQFRKIDLLSDIQIDSPDSLSNSDWTHIALENVVTDSLKASQDSIIHEVGEGCPPGLTCIEDYSDDRNALGNFLLALQRVRPDGGTLRIAFYGDSFIEGDVFCGSFRDTLQSIYGGRGVGFVPITSNVTGFRNTIKHKFENWETSSLVNKTSDAEPGPAGFTFIPLAGNFVEYRPSRQRYLREFDKVMLYYKNIDSAVLEFRIDTVSASEQLKRSGNLQQWRYRRPGARLAQFRFPRYDSLWVYGASFESDGGVYVDNFSIRGNSGLNLNRISSSMYRQFDQFRNYKLIIMQFGLNLAVEENLNYEAYVRRMVRVINGMKAAFPKASFLLLSVSDRSENVDGKFQTMPSIPVMRDAQRTIAQECGIAFWDMFAAMGGEDSMVRYVNAKPALGARDFTHLTFRGGRKLAGHLVRSLLFELKRQEKGEANVP